MGGRYAVFRRDDPPAPALARDFDAAAFFAGFPDFCRSSRAASSDAVSAVSRSGAVGPAVRDYEPIERREAPAVV